MAEEMDAMAGGQEYNDEPSKQEKLIANQEPVKQEKPVVNQEPIKEQKPYKEVKSEVISQAKPVLAKDIESTLIKQELGAPEIKGWNYEFGDKKAGKSPSVSVKTFERDEAGVSMPMYSETQAQDYQSPDKETFNNMVDWIVKRQDKQWDKMYDNPRLWGKYIDESVRRVVNKDGYYLSERDRQFLAEAALSASTRYNYERDVIPQAIKESGVAQKIEERTKNIKTETAGAFASFETKSKGKSLEISKQLDEKYKPEIDNLKTESDAINKSAQSNAQQLFNQIATPLYKAKMKQVQDEIDSGARSYDDAAAYAVSKDGQPSPLDIEIQNAVLNSKEYKDGVSGIEKSTNETLNKKVYELNQRISKEYDSLWQPYDSKYSQELENNLNVIRSKSSLTKQEGDDLRNAIKKTWDNRENDRYNKSLGIAAMSVAAPTALATTSMSLMQGIMSGKDELIASLFNTFQGTYVNEQDVKIAKDKWQGLGIDSQLLIERSGTMLAALNPASVATFVGEQVPVMAVSTGSGVLAMKGAALAANMMKTTVAASRAIGLTAGAATDWVVSTQMNNDQVRESAIQNGLSPDQIQMAIDENTKNMRWLMPLYMMQMGTLVSPSFKFTEKALFSMGLEQVQEAGENIATNISLDTAESGGPVIDPITGKEKGLKDYVVDYLKSPEAKTTFIATLAAGSILGGPLANIGGDTNKKLEASHLMRMFESSGHITPMAALEFSRKMDKITDEEFQEGAKKVERMRSAVTKVSKMELGDSNITIAAVQKLYDIHGMEEKISMEEDESVKSVLQSKLDQANKELKDITSMSKPVYVLHTPAAGPIAMSREDVSSRMSSPDFLKSIHEGTQALGIVNDPEMKAKLDESVKKYTDTRKANVEAMNVTAEGNRMSTAEAKELVDLQTREQMLSEKGQKLSEQETVRMQELKSKGAINLAAIERGTERKGKLQGVTKEFTAMVKNAMSKSFANTKIIDAVDNKEEFISGVVQSMKGHKKTNDVVYDAKQEAFIVNGTESIPLSNVHGVRVGDNIYYNPKSASKDTMIHEVAAHGWINEAAKRATITGVEGPVTVEQILSASDESLNDAGKLLKQGLQLIEGTDYEQELYGNTFYSSMSKANILEEALAQAIGEHGVKTKTDLLQRLKEWLMKFVPFMQNNKGKFIEGQVDPNMSMGDYLKGVMSDVFGQEDITATNPNDDEYNSVIGNVDMVTSFNEDRSPVKPTFMVTAEDIVAPKKIKKSGVKVNPSGHNLSFVTKSDLVDIDVIIDQVRKNNGQIWFWAADQLGLGYYSDTVIDGKHYLDAGPSYALDPKNRNRRIIWATGVTQFARLNNLIKSTDYIFLISLDPVEGMMFNKQVLDLFVKKAGDYDSFKKDILAVSNVALLDKVLNENNSWEQISTSKVITGIDKKTGKPKDSPSRKILLSLLNDQAGKRTKVRDYLISRQLNIDYNSLRDGFYLDNGFEMNDVMMVLKPESLGGKSDHSTYQTDIIGKVVGVPNRKVNAWDLISDEYKTTGKKYDTDVQKSQVIAPYGIGAKTISRGFQVSEYNQEGNAAKPVGRIFTTPHYDASIVASSYMASKNMPPVKHAIVKSLDVNLSSAIADYYESVENQPSDPEVLAAYKQMASETLDQFDHMLANGYQVEIYNGEGEPYKVAADMIKDLDENKHMYILSTKKEYGQQEYDKNDPLLKASGRYDINSEELLTNDLFRAVHDFFGHAVMGNGFGPVGEENAWLMHSQMYSEQARGVMTSETRMQNSWVNFNRAMRTVEMDDIEEEDKAIASTTSFMKSLPSEIKELLLYQWKAKQNPKWHPEGNTLKHVIMVIRRAYRMFPNDNNMIIAALFHDLGKVDTYAISEKTGQPTAYGHEKKSVEYIEKFKSWISSQAGADIDEIKYLVQNHMKIKPSTWEQMSASKKEVIEKHKSFQKLVNFTEKLDKGGIEIGYIQSIVAGDIALKDVNSTAKALKSVFDTDEKKLNGTSIEGRTDFDSIAKEYHDAKSSKSNTDIVRDVEKILGVGMRPAKPGEPGFKPLKERVFAIQKKTIAPDWIVSTEAYISQQPIVGDDNQAKFSVKDQHYPKDKNVNAIRNSRIYGQLTEDGEGNFVFFHASPNMNLDKIGVDPAKFGYNLKTSGEERQRSVPVSMYYTRVDVSDVNYKSKYFVKIPKNKVYFFNADALGLREKALASFAKRNKKAGYDLAYNANEQVGYMLLEAKKKGYKMIIAKWGNGLLRAETVDKITPTKLYDLDGNVIVHKNRVRFLSNAQKKRNVRISKDNKLASERDFKWYDRHVDDLYASDLTKDDFMSKMQTGKFVILTPENPNNQDYYEYENDNLISDFEDEMLRLEIQYTPVIGKYGRYERSYIIFDSSKATAKSMCKKFKQESVAADFGIYYLDGDKFNPRVFSQDKFMDGQMSDTDDYMSTIMTTDGPVTFSLGYDFSKERAFKSKFQIIGTEGARKSKTITKNLSVANNMEELGKNPKEIFNATGWFRDFAGEWAYEIDNSGAEMISEIPNNFVSLSSVLKFDEIYKMYPEAADIKIKMQEMDERVIGSFYNDEIILNTPYFKGDDEDQRAYGDIANERIYETIMHELQHYIQVKEGFDSGTNLDASIDGTQYIRDMILYMNESIKEGRVKLTEDEFDRYMSGIEIDITSLETINEIIKTNENMPADIAQYWFDYGEMVARYSESRNKPANIKSTPLVKIMPNGVFGLSMKRIQNIHDAFFTNTGKIATGPGKQKNIPGFQISDDSVKKAIEDEKLKRGTNMKAAAHYYSGFTETPEQREERMKLRDQVMLEILAAKDAYEQAQVEAKIARKYEGKKRDIEEAFRAQDLENRITQKLNRKIRKEQIISAFRLLGQREITEKFQEKIKTWNGMRDILITIIDDYRNQGAFKGRINARTLSTFSKMVARANTEKRLTKALAYLDKALEDKRYDELVAAIQNRKDAINAMMKGQKNPFGNLYDSVVELVSYDESALYEANSLNPFAAMETYLNMLDSISNKNIPDFKAYTNEFHIIKDMMERAIDNDVTDKVYDDVATEEQAINAMKRLQELEILDATSFIVFRKLSYSLNKKLEELFSNGLISQEKFDELSVAISRKSRSEYIEQADIRAKVEEFEAAEFTAAKNMINSISAGDMMSGFNLKYFEKLKRMVNGADGLSNFRKVGTDGIILLNKIAEQLAVGFVSPKMFKIISDVEVQANADRMTADIKSEMAESQKPGVMKRKVPDDVSKLISRIASLPKQVVDQALSLGKTKTFYKNIAYDINRAFDSIRAANRNLGNIVNKSMKKFVVGPSWANTMPKIERYRVGLIMKQLDYQSNIVDFENSGKPKDVTRYLLGDEYQKALLSDSNEYAAIKKAWESLPKDANGDVDIEAAIAGMSERERALYDTIRMIFDEHLHPMMKETNARRGEIADSQENYYRRFSQGVRASSFEDDMTPTSVVARMETYKIRSGSTQSRISDGLYWTVVDPEAVMFRAINEMTTDYYLSEVVPKAMSTLKYTNARVEGKAKYITTALQHLTRNTLVTELTVNREISNANVLIHALRAARNLLLSTPTRFFTEMIPSLSKWVISSSGKEKFGKALEKFGKQDHLYKKLFYDLSLPFKDNIGRFSLEGGESGRQSVIASMADYISTMSDIMFSKFVFKTEFDTEFLNQTGTEFDIKRYNSDPIYAQGLLDSGVMDSVAKEAMYRTERLSGPLSQFSAPSKMLWFERSSNWAKVLGFMQSYNAFEQKMFAQNVRDAISGQNEGQLKGFRNASGIIIGGMGYAMISYFITQMFKEVGGDDDDTLPEEIAASFEATYNKQSAQNLFIKSCINTLSGGYGQITGMSAGILYALVDAMVKEGHKLDPEDKKKFENMQMAMKEYYWFRPIDLSSHGMTMLKDGLAPITLFGVYVTPALDGAISLSGILSKKYNNEPISDKEEAMYNVFIGAHAVANFAGLQYPGMAMVHKALKYEAKKEGDKVKKEKESQKILKKILKPGGGSRHRPSSKLNEDLGIESSTPGEFERYDTE